MPAGDLRATDATDAEGRAHDRDSGDVLDKRLVRENVRQALFAKRSAPITVGRFMLVERLGAGGMGVVYAAYDPKLRREVALKLLHESAADDEDSHGRERLLREARALAQLSHPNVVTVHEVDEYEDGVFIAMELVKGTTLTAWMEGARSWREVVALFIEAGEGLSTAHRVGIVHRDFKPGNVLVGEDGRPRVLDFGLARQVEDVEVRAVLQLADAQAESAVGALTRSGVLLGTPAYMAPEQFLGQDVDARADQFAFCVALHEALYGERPFAAATLAELSEAVTSGQRRPPRRRGPARLQRAIVRGLSVDPRDRWPDMGSLLAALRPALGRPRLALAGVVALGSAAAVAAAYGVRSPPDPLCQGAQERLDETYGRDVRQSLAAHLQEDDHPVLEQLDAFAGRWAELHAETCDALGDEDTDATPLHLTLRCLEDRRLWAGAGIEAVLNVERVPARALPIGNLEDCSEPKRVAATPALPADEAKRSRVIEARVDLARSNTLANLGRLEDAYRSALGLVERANEIGYEPLQAEALMNVGSILMLRLDPQARPHLEEAALIAEKVGYGRVVAEVSLRMAYLLATVEGDAASARRWNRRAAAAAERIGYGAEVDPAMGMMSSIVHAASGEFDRAAAILTDTLRDHPNVAPAFRYQVYIQLAANHLSRARYEDAAEALDRAARLSEVDGFTSPQPQFLWNARALLAHLKGHSQRALPLLQRSEVRVTTEANTGFVRAMRALVQSRESRTDADRLELERIADSLEGFNPLSWPVHLGLADALVEVGSLQQAQRLYRIAAERIERDWGAGHRLSAVFIAGLGRVALAEGRLEQALHQLERAAEQVEAEPQHPSIDGSTRFALARALAASGDDGARALALAEQALVDYGRVPGPDFDAVRSELEAWIGQRRPPDTAR